MSQAKPCAHGKNLAGVIAAKIDCGGESFKRILALAHYEEPDAQWFNAAGEPWSIERLVKMQIDEPVTSGACGGCHGLFALAYARNMYISTGKPLRGVWFEADQKIKRYVYNEPTNTSGANLPYALTGIVDEKMDGRAPLIWPLPGSGVTSNCGTMSMPWSRPLVAFTL